MACFAGTVYRNYFVDVDGLKAGSNTSVVTASNEEHVQDTRRLGQSLRKQLNNLDELEAIVHNNEHNFWYLENGYTFSADQQRLEALNEFLQQNFFSTGKRDELLSSIKIGIHSDVGVTFKNRYTPVVVDDDVRVTQAYCSALSCAYAGISNAAWAPLARLVLDAAYEATLWAAVIHAAKMESKLTCADTVGTVFRSTQDASSSSETPPKLCHRTVFLTFLGGGVFGNDTEWIASAIGRALALMAHHGVELEVRICHYRRIDENMQRLVDESYQRCLQLLQNGEQV